MKKTVFLLLCIIYFHTSSCMESSSVIPNKKTVLFPSEIITLITFHYFDSAYTYFKQESPTKKITRAAYIQNICCVNRLFYALINQKEIIKKLVTLIPSKCIFPQANMPGIILCKDKSAELRIFIDRLTQHAFEKKSEPSPEMMFTIRKGIEKYLNEGADIDGRLFLFQKKELLLPPPNETCLYLAVDRNCYEYTKLLLELGADPDFTKSEYTPIQKAIHNKNIRLMQLLFDFGARNNKCLVEAVNLKYIPAIKLIISREDLSAKELDYTIEVVASCISDNAPIMDLLKTVKRKENQKKFVRRNGHRTLFSLSDSP